MPDSIASGGRSPGDWVLDEGTIRSLVGSETAARGRAYAARGAVSALVGASAGSSDVWMARVAGTAPAPYTVVVRRRGEPVGSCSCPMRINCKHVAAVLFEISGQTPAPGRAAWENQLGAGVGGRPAARATTVDLALQFEVTERPQSVPPARIEIRPVIRGASGRWVRTGVTWSALRYRTFEDLGLREGDHRLLEEIVALNASSRTYAYGYSSQERVFLETFPSRRIWDMLAEGVASGVTLIGGAKGTESVTLEEQPVDALLDVDTSASEWLVTPTLRSRGNAISVDSSILLGRPAHGVAWWTRGATAESLDGIAHLRIARLDRVLDTGLQPLFARRVPISIPEHDQARFLGEFYPGLKHRATVASLNGSFEAPAEHTRLLLTLGHGLNTTVDIEWSWAHSIGDFTRRLSLWATDLPAGDDDRRRVLEQAQAAAGRLPQLLGGSRADPRLEEHALLQGMDAVRFSTEVLPLLRVIDGLDIVETGAATPYREAVNAPVISLTGKPGESADWFDLSVTVSVDGEDVPFQSLFVALVENRSHLILPSGTYFAVDRPELHQLRALIAEARGLDDQRTGTLRVSRFQTSLWQELEALGTVSRQASAWAASVNRLRTAELTAHPLPSMVRATLRPYQQVGFNWLAFLHENQLGGVLADDMGLGKTLQTIALMAHVRERTPKAPPFLVVAPTSVVANWTSECRRFAPDLGSVMVTETATRRGVALAALRRGQVVVVTSYALFRIEFEDYARLKWSGLILDEAQAVKNHQSRGYQLARRLRAPFKLAVTGTPMENNLMELWSMFSITAPGLFGDPRQFGETFRAPIERDGNVEPLERLQRRIRPLLLRRTKEQVADDLPQKLEQVLELELNPQHRRVYDTYLQRERQKVLGLLGDVRRNRFEIFRSLTLLRQVSIDPSLVDDRHHAVPSTKLDALLEQLEDVIAEGHRALIFSQFTRFLGHVRSALDNRGIEYCYLDGSTQRRPEVVERFKTGGAPLFLISLKAGGVGLNLAEADYCFLLDPWWNPATEAQAVDRAHRIGQTRRVMVYRLVARDTIEEKVMALKARKQALFTSVVDGGGATSSALTEADIRGLLE